MTDPVVEVAPRRKRPAQDIQAATIPFAWLRLKTVAELVSMRPRTVMAWVKRGAFPPPFRVGAQNRWRASDIQQWMKAQGEVTPPA